MPGMHCILRRKPPVPVTAEDAELLFEKDEPEYQMAMAAGGDNGKKADGEAQPAHAGGNGGGG